MINKLVILAAGMGSRLRPITNNIPKCLTPIKTKTILGWQIDIAKKAGIEKILVVGGYKAEKINYEGIDLILNPIYKSSNMAESLRCALEKVNDEFILSYGDILFEEKILLDMMCLKKDISIASDMNWLKYWSERFKNPLEDAETFKFTSDNFVSEIGKKTKDLKDIESQYIGLISFSSKGTEILKKWFSESYKDENIFLTDMLNEMAQSGIKIYPHKINNGWLEIDNLKDLEIAKKRIFINSVGDLKIRR